MRRFLTRNLTSPFLNLSMRGKLFSLFLLVAFIPLLSFVFYSYHTVKSQLIRQTFASAALMTSQINSNLENKLDNYNKISASLYLDETLQDYLVKSYRDNADFLDAYRYIDNVMNNVLTTNPEVFGIAIYTTNASMHLDDTFIKPLTDVIEQKPWFHKVQNTYGNVIFTITPAQPADPPRKATPPMFTLVRYLNYNSLNFPYGILAIDIQESELYALIDKEDKDKDIYIVDEQGTIVSGKDKTRLNANIGEWLALPRDTEGSGRFETIYEGEKVLVVYNAIRSGWKTISIIPYSGFMEAANRSTHRLLVIASVCLLLCMVLIYAVARLSTKRIETLLKNIRRLEREDFELVSMKMGHDEIGQMSFALNKMAARFKNLINEVYKKEISKQEAELGMLQAQINPHFLYNTLASISALAMKNDDRRTQDMVSHLAKFYRISLNKGKSIVSLNEELKLTHNYIAIQQIRYQDLIHIHYRIEDDVRSYPTVKLTLQPFIENSIRHGLWDDDYGIGIVIKAYRKDGDIFLEVIDDGMGMPCDKPAGGASLQELGYGISNVDQRIKLAFGAEYGVSIFSRPGIGTQVVVRLPSGGVADV
ncbi:two-component system, sensor histidine kinase YesM [Cohnella sp. OV330]|uniref:cache domain-containing sensor histidine kinase n=1 Tax=Cohnella sp. OV330 TaxID=1855288 RepID=UPI0008E591BE|nr:sensor histidine kinase [Cohnella sp. OV330]SFB28276.1 two-component system, sensor histidine kinase YesM [Cohnella sp. OV330]